MNFTDQGTDWKLLKQGGEYAVQYVHEHNHNYPLFITSIRMRKCLVEELFSRKDDTRELNQELLGKYEEIFREGKRLPYFGGHSTAHLDKNGRLVDCYEILLAFLHNCKGDDYLYLHLHLGIAPGTLDNVRTTRVVPQPKVEEKKEEEEVVPVKVKPVYKYSPIAIMLIMAYENDSLGIQTSHKYDKRIKSVDTIEWVKKNDHPLLAECMDKNYCAAISKVVGSDFLTGTELMALRYITASRNADSSRIFYSLIRSRTDLGMSSALTTLKNILSKPEVFAGTTLFQKMSVFIQLWNCFRNGTPGPISWVLEQFPEAK